MNKIDIDKFVVSLLNSMELTNKEKRILHHAIQDQGLRIKNGEIISIEPETTKAGNWYVCKMEIMNESMTTAFHRDKVYYCPKDGYIDVDGALFKAGTLDVFRPATAEEIPQNSQCMMSEEPKSEFKEKAASSAYFIECWRWFTEKLDKWTKENNGKKHGDEWVRMLNDSHVYAQEVDEFDKPTGNWFSIVGMTDHGPNVTLKICKPNGKIEV